MRNACIEQHYNDEIVLAVIHLPSKFIFFDETIGQLTYHKSGSKDSQHWLNLQNRAEYIDQWMA